MTAITLQDITAETIAETARAAGEPGWLIERRIEAWEHFARSVPPEWRRTDLSGLKPELLAPPSAPQGTAIQWDESLAQQGVVFSPLTAVLHSHEELIKKYMDTAVAPLEHKFSALRAALWQDGVLLYVPRNVAVEMPLRVCYTLADGQRAAFPRSLVILDQGASVTFIEEYTSNDRSEPALVGPISEVFAGPGSQVRYISVQHWGAGVYHIGGQKLVLDRDANSEWTSVALGGQVQHIESETTLKGDGSKVNWLGATFASGKQQLLTGPWLRHVGNQADSFMQFKTVVNDMGYSVFDGMIKIEKDTKGTATRLEEHALHLNPNARNDSIPGLKIDSNDVVRGGHASTSGDVDDMQLFYMQARGIKKDDAKRMIVMGFFEPALNTIPVEELRDELATIIEGKI
jgi:Fe-S cluster assembly protein SufD